VIVDNSILFVGTYSQGSGFKLAYGVTSIPIGVGNWQPQGADFARTLLEDSITYADMAHAARQQVAISEAWLARGLRSTGEFYMNQITARLPCS